MVRNKDIDRRGRRDPKFFLTPHISSVQAPGLWAKRGSGPLDVAGENCPAPYQPLSQENPNEVSPGLSGTRAA